MKPAELFALPVGTWLTSPEHYFYDNGLKLSCLLVIHASSPDEVILRRQDDSGYWDVDIHPDCPPWTTEDFHVLEFTGFPPDRNGKYLYREFIQTEKYRATVETTVLVVDGELLHTRHKHHGQPVDTLTTGPRAVGEWAFLSDPEPVDCLESMVEIDPETGERCIMVPDFESARQSLHDEHLHRAIGEIGVALPVILRDHIRLDSEGRDVTDLPGLHCEADTLLPADHAIHKPLMLDLMDFRQAAQ